jgi:hypothetical protein
MVGRRGQNLGGVEFVRRSGVLRGGVEFCEEEWSFARVEFCEELSR